MKKWSLLSNNWCRSPWILKIWFPMSDFWYGECLCPISGSGKLKVFCRVLGSLSSLLRCMATKFHVKFFHYYSWKSLVWYATVSHILHTYSIIIIISVKVSSRHQEYDNRYHCYIKEQVSVTFIIIIMVLSTHVSGNIKKEINNNQLIKLKRHILTPIDKNIFVWPFNSLDKFNNKYICLLSLS